MDLSSYYQSVFYQSRDSVSLTQQSVCDITSTQQNLYTLCENEYKQQGVCEDSYMQERCLFADGQVLNKYNQPNDSPPYISVSPPHHGRVPRIPPLAVLQQRRLAANARERKRANKINFAFNRLRKVLPGFEDREISKFEAIILAQDYIKQLVEILNNEEDKENTQVTALKWDKLEWNSYDKEDSKQGKAKMEDFEEKGSDED